MKTRLISDIIVKCLNDLDEIQSNGAAPYITEAIDLKLQRLKNDIGEITAALLTVEPDPVFSPENNKENPNKLYKLRFEVAGKDWKPVQDISFPYYLDGFDIETGTFNCYVVALLPDPYTVVIYWPRATGHVEILELNSNGIVKDLAQIKKDIDNFISSNQFQAPFIAAMKDLAASMSSCVEIMSKILKNPELIAELEKLNITNKNP